MDEKKTLRIMTYMAPGIPLGNYISYIVFKYLAFKSHRMQWWIQDFPEVGAPTLQGALIYDFAKFSQKLQEIERIWTQEGARVQKFTM